MKYWLLKSEPDAFSIDDLIACKNGTEPWDGIRNYQARNMIRDDMNIGDQAFFYHSSCKIPGIVGKVEITSEPFPDPLAFNPESKYFDPKSDPANPRWFAVNVTFIEKLSDIVSLSQLKQNQKLLTTEFPLLQKGNRLSVLPVTTLQWRIISQMS